MFNEKCNEKTNKKLVEWTKLGLEQGWLQWQKEQQQLKI